MHDSARREFLLGLVAAAIGEHDRWASRPDLTYITAGVDEAMTDLCDGFAEGTIPGELRQLQRLVAEFADRWHEWQAEVDRRGSAAVPPSEAAWKAWEALVACYRGASAPPRPPIESVATLRAQQVSDRQICQIYGWIDARGNPEIWKVDEELAQPGKHTKDWVDPITRRRQEAAEREQALAERVRRLRERKVARMDAGCPESLEDLVRQGVSLPQVAKMLRLGEEEVLAQCEAQGLPRPPMGPSLHATRGEFEPELPEPMARQFAAQEASRDRRPAEDARTGQAEALSLEQQILQYHEQGFGPAEIASELSSEDEKVSERKVKAVIRRYEEDPEAFAMPGGR